MSLGEGWTFGTPGWAGAWAGPPSPRGTGARPGGVVQLPSAAPSSIAQAPCAAAQSASVVQEAGGAGRREGSVLFGDRQSLRRGWLQADAMTATTARAAAV